MSKAFYVSLKNRGLVHIEGEDRKAFLQGLVSNDLDKLEHGKILYACLLTPQGKFLHDFFIHEADGFLLLDCEGGARAQDLFTRLSKFKLRSKVKLSMEDSHPVYAILSPEHPGRSDSDDPGSTDPRLLGDAFMKDPRHPALGYRTFEKPYDMEERSFDCWDRLRIELCIPDGSRDMEIEKSTLDEGHIDKLNGVAWDKGCYMGQELTARMHYRGLGKKHLRTVKIIGPSPVPFTDLPNGGQMRSSCGNIGLALLKDDDTTEVIQ